jgi:hypothetical protein
LTDYLAQVSGQYSATVGFTFGRHITSAQSPSALLTTWSNAWIAAWNDGTHGLKVIYPTTTSITGFSITTLDSIYHQTARVSTSALEAGTAVGDTLPWQESILVSLSSSTQIGKHSRGRMYLPALEETFVNGDVVVGTEVTRVSAAVNAVRAAVVADGSSFFSVAMGKPRAIPPVPPGPKYITDVWKVSNKPARQSRRVRKIRPTYE